MSDVFIGRQPIFDRDLNIAYYELLYRNSLDNAASFTNSDVASAEVFLNTLVDIGIDRIAGDKRVFINLTRDYLVGDWPIPLDQNRVGIELLEEPVVDQALLDALESRSRAGYVISLDDFVFREHLRPLLYIADLVKLDVQALGREGVADQYRLLRKFPLKLVAAKVETREEHAFCHELGFDCFQGHFIARPRVIRGRGVAADHTSTLMLLAEINDPDVSLDALAGLISRDVGLSFKLLRYINSAFFNLPRELETVRAALVYLGLRPLKVWVSLIVIATMSDQPDAARHQAIVRARLCENLAGAMGQTRPGRFFTIGLFSTLDALLDMPMGRVLDTLPLSGELKDGLVKGEGVPGQVLACAREHEQGCWEQARSLGLSPDQVNTAYLEAIEWADNLSQVLQRP